MLGLVNRPGNRPSHEGAAAEVDRALAVCFRGGFRQVLLRGDTDFSQTEHLDRWHDDRRVRFIFGYEAAPNLRGMAEDLPARAWRPLQRPPHYAVRTQPRRRPAKVKEAIVVARGFDNLRLCSEEVAEFNYRPTACTKTYRMVVVRKNISRAKGDCAGRLVSYGSIAIRHQPSARQRAERAWSIQEHTCSSALPGRVPALV